MFREKDRVGVAVSGGRDSVCLLHVLLELAPRWDLRLSVLHLNHELRGGESEGDAEFVRDLAARLGLPAIISRRNVRKMGGNLEQAAREARREFFAELRASGAVDAIAVGQTSADQAETVLFRFLRGAGTAGLAGIRPVSEERIVRPLLGVTRQEVEAYLREKALVWREDSSNTEPIFARNRIRHSLLPQLEREWNPALEETLAHMADWAAEEESWWAGELNRLAAEHIEKQGFAVVARADTLAQLPRAVGRRLVRRMIEMAKGDLRRIDFPHVEQVLDLAAREAGHGRRQIPDLEVCRSFDWIRIGAREPAHNFQVPAQVPGVVELPGRKGRLSLDVYDRVDIPKLDSGYNCEVSLMDWERVSGPLEVRNWRPGDQYQAQGHAGDTKVKNLFQQARIPVWERRDWPVILRGSEIVWSRQFGPARHVAADSNTRSILAIRECDRP